MIKYLGSKRLLLPHILQAVRELAPTGTVLDLFSGTSRVGLALKSAGYRVVANDYLAYAHILAQCYVQADAETWLEPAARLVEALNRLPGRPGYITATFCEQARYFQPANGERIDAIRKEIDRLDLHPELRAVLLTSLLEAADRVDSTTGVQMAYLKQWAQRAHRPLELRVPQLVPRAAGGAGLALHGEALAAAHTPADVAYLDPPYNAHSYLGNYHVWETLVRGDEPETYGVARKRVDRRERVSVFNSRPRFEAAFAELLQAISAPNLVVSFSDEGFVGRDAMVAMLSRRGTVRVLEVDYKRYVGAQIGIYNPEGARVGTPGHLRNREYLFVVTPDR